MSFNSDNEKNDDISEPITNNYKSVNNDSEDLFEDNCEETDSSNTYMDNSNNEDTNQVAFKLSMNSDIPMDCAHRKIISESKKSVGADLSRLNSNLKLPPISVGSKIGRRSKDKVFVRWPLVKKDQDFVVPQPYPERSIKDRWDEYHVRMPCSTQSQFPVLNSDGIKVLKNRWELIENAISNRIRNVDEFEERILSYNRSGRWSFNGVKERFPDDDEGLESDAFFNKIIPEICALALRLPFLLTAPVPLLRRGCNQSLSFSQYQIASLLANAFFCTFPRRNATGRQTEYANFPIINFNRLFSTGDVSNEKLSCLINYFRRVTQEESPKGVVTFTRRSLSESQLPNWKLSTKCLPELRITSEGTIEDNGTGMLQVDFANSYIGGGALGHGCVQEEIRFMICPELIASMLFTEQLDDLECLIISGHERYSNYSGYASNFQFSGNHVDPTEMDTSSFQGNKRKSYLVAIDALYFRSEEPQYSEYNIKRELNKAFVGFHSEDESNGGRIQPVAVATGNWGCGAFRGDPHLKALIQLMAAAECNRDVYYFTFGDENLRDNILDMHSLIKRNSVTIGKLYDILTGYDQILQTSRGIKPRLSLYKYIKMQLDSFDQDTDEERPNTDSPNNTLGTSPHNGAQTSKQQQTIQYSQIPCGSNSKTISADKESSSSELNSSGTSVNSSKSEKQAKVTDYFSRK